MALSKRFSAFIALVAIVPCLFAADGLYSAFFPTDRPPSDPPDAYVFPQYALPTNSGYLVVDEHSRARMFYAFYEAISPEQAVSATPIILWLQGGPGCSSMTGNFYELGPWKLSEDLVLYKNEAPWNSRFGVLFIDNPVGSGFSIAEKDEDIPTDQEQIATHLYTALQLFFHSLPSFRSRPFFIAGESYGGKYVPALGYYIMKANENVLQEEPCPLRLDGLLIGNGLTDPIVQVQTHADTAYNFGLLDHIQKAQVEKLASEVVELIEREDWARASSSRSALMDYIQEESGLATVLDIRRIVPYHSGPDGKDFLAPFLNLPAVKAALRADESAQWVACNPRVRQILAPDVMKSVKWQVEALLQKYPILLYQGQYDAKDGVACSEEWMKTISWSNLKSFFSSERKLWRVQGALAGYWRSFGTLTHVVILGAGHQVPADQGLASQQMVETWIAQQLPNDALGTA